MRAPVCARTRARGEGLIRRRRPCERTAPSPPARAQMARTRASSAGEKYCICTTRAMAKKVPRDADQRGGGGTRAQARSLRRARAAARAARARRRALVGTTAHVYISSEGAATTPTSHLRRAVKYDLAKRREQHAEVDGEDADARAHEDAHAEDAANAVVAGTRARRARARGERIRRARRREEPRARGARAGRGEHERRGRCVNVNATRSVVKYAGSRPHSRQTPVRRGADRGVRPERSRAAACRRRGR